MKIKNKLYNWWHKVKRVKTKGSRNVGTMKKGNEWILIKYDWNKKFKWVSKQCKIWPSTHPVPLHSMRTGQKCDICGSTAIDHTENQCSLNRQLQKWSSKRNPREINY